MNLVFKLTMTTKVVLSGLAFLIPTLAYFFLGFDLKTTIITLVIFVTVILFTVLDSDYYKFDHKVVEIIQKHNKTSISISEIECIERVTTPGKLTAQNTNYYIITKNKRIRVNSSYQNSNNQNIIQFLHENHKIKVKDKIKLIDRG